MKTVGAVLAALLAPYRARTPVVATIEAALRECGALAPDAALPNDHVAFRTIGVPPLGIGSLEPLLGHLGYERRDAFVFAEKQLDACWFSPPDDMFPRVFVSELRVDDVAPAAAAIVRAQIAGIGRGPLDGVDLDDPAAVTRALEALPWPRLTRADYETLLTAGEYAAWTLVNGYRINHLTFAVHELSGALASIDVLVDDLRARGIRLSDAGGTIKTSPDGLLRQASTVAATLIEPFADGMCGEVAGSYIEFAERAVLPAFADLPRAELRRRHRREGFETANADRIFESTRERQG